MSREYAAFISYRHQPLDMKVADKVHEMIERYVIPKELRKDSKKHLDIAFRDQEELPLTSDLTGSIYEALDHSQFLVVICTPETPKSQWVAREIEYFINRHSRDRVLTVLAAGTMDESVPKAITTIYGADGVTPIGQCEPLAAMIASSTHKQTMRLLKKEFPRLAAAMIGCPYDALIQRSKRRKMQLATAALGVVAAVALTFTGMLLKKNAEVEEQLQQALINESKALAQTSIYELDHGARRDALKMALQALPSEDQPRPYCGEAEAALVKALQIYETRNVRLDQILRVPDYFYESMVTPDGQSVITLDRSGYVRCFNAYTGEEQWAQKFGYYKGYDCWMELIQDCSAVLVRGRTQGLVVDIQTGNLLRHGTWERTEDDLLINYSGDLNIYEKLKIFGGYYDVENKKAIVFDEKYIQPEGTLTLSDEMLISMTEDRFAVYLNSGSGAFLFLNTQTGALAASLEDSFLVLQPEFEINVSYRHNWLDSDGTTICCGFEFSEETDDEQITAMEFVRLDASGHSIDRKKFIPEQPWGTYLGYESNQNFLLISATQGILAINKQDLSHWDIPISAEVFDAGIDPNGNLLLITGTEKVGDAHSAYFFPAYVKNATDNFNFDIDIHYDFTLFDDFNNFYVYGTSVFLEAYENNTALYILRPLGQDFSIPYFPDWTGLYDESESTITAEQFGAKRLWYGTKGFAIMLIDDHLYLYSPESNTLSDPLPIPVPENYYGNINLVHNNQVVLIGTELSQRTAYDISTGEILGIFSVTGSSYGTDAQQDITERYLYIWDNDHQGTGIRIDMETWTVIAEIPMMMIYQPNCDLIVRAQAQYGNYDFISFPTFTTEELISMGNEILSGK